jgi:uncharacterized protein involved in exopolysaccharide biosynthesis
MPTPTDSERDWRLPTVRDLITPIFRHKRAGILAALVLFTATASAVLLAPQQYEAEMKFLVKRERADTIVSADPHATPQGPTQVTEDELNSEVELLKSRDLLEQVARAAGLIADTRTSTGGGSPAQPDAATVARVVRRLETNLRIAPLRRTTFIKVTYRSTDPAEAARVLDRLASLYFEKHLALHRPPGAYDFFSEQAERFRRELASAEKRLEEYGREEHVFSAETQKASTLQQLATFEAGLHQTRGEIAEAARRILEITTQIAATSPRQTTQMRTFGNAELLRHLKSRILDLEVQRDDMLRKFTPTYPPVLRIEEQLAQARTALERTEQSPLTEETTDQDRTYEWLRTELVRVRTERAAAVARSQALERSVQQYAETARQLDEKGTEQAAFKRAIRSSEENYLLYKRKQEEARISDALDRTRIANVVLADAPRVPTLPANTGRAWILVLGAFVALTVGVTVTYLLEYISPFFHSPDDVESTLSIPVLATWQTRQ